MDIKPDDDNERVVDGNSDGDSNSVDDNEDNRDDDNERVVDGNSDGDRNSVVDDNKGNRDDDNEMEYEGDPDEDSVLEYDITIFGRNVSTVYTTSEDYVNTWITNIHYPNGVRTLVVGLDMHLLDMNRPNPLIATIQLCINGQCLVYHMYFALHLPMALRRFMTDRNNTFVGVQLERKLQVLKYWDEYRGHIAYRNLGSIAERHYNNPKLLHADTSQLAFGVLGKYFVIPEVDPDWDRPVLDDGQICDASVSAYVSYELGRALLN